MTSWMSQWHVTALEQRVVLSFGFDAKQREERPLRGLERKLEIPLPFTISVGT